MKKVLVAALLIVAIVLGISMTGYADYGMFLDNGFVFADNQIQTELTERTGADIQAIPVNVYDPIYSRGSNFYVGKESKQLFTNAFPMYISDGAGVKLLDASGVLFNSELSSEKSYEELVVSGGRVINPGDIPFSLDEFVLLRLGNGLYINSGYMYVETTSRSYAVPSNSIICFSEDLLNYYQYENGLFTYHAIFDIDAESLITIGSMEKTYGELLRGLGEVLDFRGIDPTQKTDDPQSAEKGEGKRDLGHSGITGKEIPSSGTDTNDQPTNPSPEAPGEKQESERQTSTEKKPKKEGSGKTGGGSSGPLPSSAIPRDPGAPEPAKSKPEGTAPIANPNYVKPEVKAGATFIPGVYSLQVSAIVKDPAGVIKSGLVYVVTTYNTDGTQGTAKKFVFDGYTADTDSLFLISGLKPDTKYSVRGEYTYKDEYGRTVNEPVVFMSEKDFTTKPVADLGTVSLDDWNLDKAVYAYNSITIPNLKFKPSSDIDAVASMTKMEIRFLKKGDSPDKTIGIVVPASSLNRIKSLQSIAMSSGTRLDPASEYSIEVVCYDRYGNLLVVDNNKGTSKTSLRLPEGRLKVENTEQLEQIFTAEINDYGNVGFTNAKVRIFDNIGNPVLINGEDGFAITTSEAVTVNTLTAKKNYTAQLYVDCDIKDDQGMISRVISTVRFTTDSLDSLGSLIVEAENITDKYLREEISAAAIALGDKLTEEELSAAVEQEKTNRAVFSLKINPRTKRALIDHLDIFTMSLQCGTEVTTISFTEDELEQFTTYDAINNKYTDAVIIDTADYTKLQSKSTYRISYTAQEIYDKDNAEYGDIHVNAGLSSFKTLIAQPDLVISNINALQSFLGFDVHIDDVDDFIKGDSIVVKIYKKISETRQTLVAAFRVPKNAPDNFNITLTPDTSMSTDGQSYDIEGGSTYYIRAFAEEITVDSRNPYNYLLGEIEKEAILSASGKIYAGGLEDIGNGKLEATILMRVNDPQNAVDGNIRSIAVDEYNNKGNAAPVALAEPLVVTSYSGINRWSKECWLGSDGEYYDASASGFTQLPAGYSRYDYVILNTNATIPAVDVGLDAKANGSCIIRYDAGDGIKITYASNKNVSGEFHLFSDSANLADLNGKKTVKLYDYIVNNEGVITHLLPAVKASGECGLCVQSSESDAKFFAFEDAVPGTRIAMEKDVPTQYIAVDYILTDGTQYIDTGLESTEIDRLLCDIQPLQVANDMHFMGTRSASSNNYRIYFAFNKSFFYHGWNSINTSTSGDMNAIVNGRYSIDSYIGMASQYLKVNGNTVASGNTEMQTSHVKTYLFAWNGNGTVSPQYNGRTYSVQLYYNGTMLRDYIPVYNALTREYGFFDTKNPQGFVSATKGTLQGGTGLGLSKTFMEGLTFFRTTVDKDPDTKNTYQFDMHYDFVVGENVDGSDKLVQVPLSTTKFSTEDEIGTIATGDEFLVKGTSNKKYIVVDDILLDNTDRSTYMMDILNAQIDFQGFSLDYKANHQAIINQISSTGEIKNAVIKSYAPLSRVAYSPNPTAIPTVASGDVCDRKANTLATNNYGHISNVKIEMGQEQYSDKDGKYLMSQGTYWTDLSKVERESYQEIINRGKEDEAYIEEYNAAYAAMAAHRYPTFRSAAIIHVNYGVIENFVVETLSQISGHSYVGSIAVENGVAGIVQNGYVYGSYHNSDENHTAEFQLTNVSGMSNSGELCAGGVVAHVRGKNSLLQNVYAIVDVSTTKADFDKLGGIAGRNEGSGARVLNCYVVGDLTLNSKNKPAYGPAIGYNNGGTNTNIYYYSDNSYKNANNTFNTEISLNSIRNSTWQNNLLNSIPANKRFNVDAAMQVNCYPQISYTSNCMPAQSLLSLPETRLSASSWDIVYAFTYADDPSNTFNETLLPHVQGNLAWVEDPNEQYYASDEQVLCVMIADASERTVYSISIEDFDLSHEDILEQVKDGNGITTLYVRMHNPLECKTNYLIDGIQFTKSNGQPDVFVSTIGARYAYIEYYRRIDSAKDGKNGWVDFKQHQKQLKKTATVENIYLNNDIDFTGTTLAALSWYDISFGGKFDGNNKTLRNIEFDANVGSEVLSSTTDPKGTMNMGLFGTITGEVYDVVFDNCMIEVGDNVGMLAGYSNGATITNVLVKNSSVGGGRYVGGLVSYAYLTNIYASGVMNTKIANFCSGDSSNGNYQDVTSDMVFCTGGLVGMLNDLTDIDKSFAQNVYIESQGADACGGLVGFVNWSLNNVNIRNCYSTGEIISMDDYAGGFVGLNMSAPTITSCYSDVDIYAYGSIAGGFFGGNASGVYKDKIMTFGNVSSAQIYASNSDEHISKYSTQLVVGRTTGQVSAAVYTDATIDINGVKQDSGFRNGADIVFTLEDYLENNVIFRILDTEYFEKGQSSGYLPHIIAEDNETALKAQMNEYVSIAASPMRINAVDSDYINVEVPSNVTDVKIYTDFTFAEENIGTVNYGKGQNTFAKYTALRTEEGTWSRDGKFGVDLNIRNRVHYYDTYWLTGIRYTENEKEEFLRVGRKLDILPEYRNITSRNDWETIVVGSHGENFKLTSDIDFRDIDFSNHTFHPYDGMCSMIINRLEGYNTDSTANIAKISQFDLVETTTTFEHANGWQTNNGAGFIKIVLSQLSNIAFDDITINRPYSMHNAIIGKVQGPVSNVSFTNCTFNSRCAGSCIYDLRDSVSGITLSNINSKSTSLHMGGWLATVYDPLWYNSKITGITAENLSLYDNATTDACSGGLIEYARNLQFMGHSAPAPRAETEVCTVSNVNITNCHITGATVDTALVIAGPSYVTLDNIQVNDSSIKRTVATGNTGENGIIVAYGDNKKITIQNSTVDNCILSIPASSNGGGIAGLLKTSTIKNCTVTNSKVNGLNNMGGIIGSASGTTVSNCEINNCTIGGGSYVGGISGRYALCSACKVADSTITNTGDYTGGIYGGYNSTSTITGDQVINCTIKSNGSNVAGIGGDENRSSDGVAISECYVSGCHIEGNNYVGGLIHTGSQPRLNNTIENSEIIAKGNYVGGAIAAVVANNSTVNNSYINSENGTFSAWVKNCNIYGKSSVGGACGNSTASTAYRYGFIVQNCDVRGLAYVGGAFGGANNATSNSCCDYVENTYISELDSETADKYGISTDSVVKEYFGGVFGYAAYSDSDMVYNSIVNAPNANYVGAVGGRVSSVNANSYGLISKDSVVVGGKYVGGLFGVVRPKFNATYAVESNDTHRATIRDSYSNALVYGSDYVAGIAGSYETESGTATNPTTKQSGTYYMPGAVVKSMYFTGALNSTDDSSKASAILGHIDVRNSYLTTRKLVDVQNIASLPDYIRVGSEEKEGSIYANYIDKQADTPTFDVKDSFNAVYLMDSTVLLTDGKDSPDMITTDAAVRAGLASVASPGTISLGGNYSVLTCAGLKDNMLEVVGGKFYWKSKPSEDIPKGYVEVEYLQNSNANQKLVIPVTGKAGQYFGIRGRINQVDYPANGKSIFASNTGSQFSASTYSYTANTNRIVNASTFGTQSTNGGWTTEMGVPSNFTLDTLHIETDITKKELVRPITQNFSSLTFFNTSQIIRLYSLETLSGTELEHSLIPVKRLSDNTYGMYDIVGNKFYGNQGTGSFVGGPELQLDTVNDSLAPFISSSFNNENHITYSSNGKNEFKVTIKQGVFLPLVEFNSEKYHNVLKKQHLMYSTFQVSSEELRAYSIGIIGLDSVKNITTAMSYINIFADNVECDKIRIEIDNEILNQNYGSEEVSQKIKSVYLSLLSDGLGFNSSDNLTHQKLDIGAANSKIRYNFVDTYECTISFELEGRRLNDPSQITTREISKRFVLTPDDLRNPLVLTDVPNYQISSTALLSNNTIIANGIVNVAGHNLLLLDGTSINLDEPIIESHIIIPEEYVEIEYLQNSDSNQKLVIPVTGKAGQYFGIRGRLNQINYPAGGKPIFASNAGSQFYASTYSYTASTNRIVNGSTFGTQSTNGGWTTEMGVPSNFTLDTLHIETDITKKELVRPITQNFSSLTFFNTSQIIRLYSLETLSGTELEHSLIPVKRLSDNTYGMYDIVGNKFYGNQGTGSFVGGGIIE